jgi:xylulokinase
MGVDIGSTTIKAVIYGTSGNIISIGRVDTGSPEPVIENGEKIECWIPETLWQNVVEAIKTSIKKIENSSYIRGIAVSAFGDDGGPIDKNGNVLYPFISWQYTGTSQQMEDFLHNISPTDAFMINGQAPWYACSVFRMMWMKKNKPQIYSKIYKWLLIQDFINYRLCGNAASDYTISSTTLLLDQEKRNWSDYLLKISGIDERILPQLKQSGDFLGGVTREAALATGLNENTPVIIGGHDNICGSLAASGYEDGVLVDIGGTFESMILHSPKPVLSKEYMKANLITESSVVKNLYALYGFQYYTGCTEWIKSLMESTDNIGFWDYFKSNVNFATKPGSGGLLFMPYLTGSYFPKDEKVSGAIFGLTSGTGRLEMIRSLIEGLNFLSRDLLGLITKFSKKEIKVLRVIGGIAYNTFWMQNKADILKMPLEVPDIPEATSLGLAILAGIGSGVYSGFKEAAEKTKKSFKMYLPDEKNTVIYDNIYKNIFSDLYGTIRKISYNIRKYIKK